MREIYRQLAAIKAAMLAVAMMSVGGVFIFSYLVVACIREGQVGLAITAGTFAVGLMVTMKGSVETYRLNKKIMLLILEKDYQAAQTLIESMKK